MFLTAETPSARRARRATSTTRRLAALAPVDLFAALPETSASALADQLAFTPFAAGEAVTREGEHDDGLYMLVEGDARCASAAAPTQREVGAARRRPVLRRDVADDRRGAHRDAWSRRPTSCATAIDKPAFERILRETPAMAEQIAEVLASPHGADRGARRA